MPLVPDLNTLLPDSREQFVTDLKAAFSNPWFESVAVAQERARKRLPSSVYGALIAGADAGVSLDDNLDAFEELGLRPITAGQPAERQMATEVMGQPISMPVLISPTGVQAVHPDGEV
ncbi:MAG: alpha-hydroxy-acid oxidizing protein, partial [Acidimicrobiales bacterium]